VTIALTPPAETLLLWALGPEPSGWQVGEGELCSATMRRDVLAATTEKDHVAGGHYG
jgi:hypothetical protein